MATTINRGRRQRRGQGMFRFNVETSPSLQSIAELYGSLIGEEEDWKAPLRDVGAVIADGMRRNYDSRGSYFGENWPRPRRPYAQRKARDGFGSVQMIRTGRTRRRLDQKSAMSVSRSRVSVGWSGQRWKHVPSLAFGGGIGGPGKRKPAWQAEHKLAGWTGQMQFDSVGILSRWIDQRISTLSRALRSSSRRSG